jgi:hypothetical protein
MNEKGARCLCVAARKGAVLLALYVSQGIDEVAHLGGGIVASRSHREALIEVAIV